MKNKITDVAPVNDKLPTVYEYDELVNYLKNYKLAENEFPLIMPNWDNTPRTAENGVVLINSEPLKFQAMVKDAVKKVKYNFSNPSEQIIFLKAWNEWAEGNYMEPDLDHGYAYLEALKQSIEY